MKKTLVVGLVLSSVFFIAQIVHADSTYTVYDTYWSGGTFSTLMTTRNAGGGVWGVSSIDSISGTTVYGTGCDTGAGGLGYSDAEVIACGDGSYYITTAAGGYIFFDVLGGAIQERSPPLDWTAISFPTVYDSDAAAIAASS